MNLSKYFLAFLGLAAFGLFLALWQLPDSNLHLIACDVGQGDAILATYKNIQILTDGGPNGNKALDCLSKYMPFWDREIEMVVLTHPQIDHFGGLIEVFKRYKVDNFVANTLEDVTFEYRVLEKLVGSSGTRVINPKAGMVIGGGLIHLDILNPTELVLAEKITSDRQVNDISVVSILSLGSFDALLTGDISPTIIPEILRESSVRPVEYIKVPHHGSRYGLTAEMLDAFEPKLAVISLKKGNPYGHPHQETLKMLNDKNIKILRTDEKGDIEVITDGEKWWVN